MLLIISIVYLSNSRCRHIYQCNVEGKEEIPSRYTPFQENGELSVMESLMTGKISRREQLCRHQTYRGIAHLRTQCNLNFCEYVEIYL